MRDDRLDIGVVGAGAIGGFLAAKLASVGHAPRILARGRTLDALLTDGLRLYSATGDVATGPLVASDDAAALGGVDLLIFAVKGQDTEAAAEAMTPMVRDDSLIVTFQNGLGGLETLERRFGRSRLAPGVTYVPATAEAQGVIRHTGAIRRFVFGPLGPPDQRLEALAGLGQAAGLEMELVADPIPAIWEKLAMLSAFHGVSALVRLPLGDWVREEATAGLYLKGMKEVAAVAAASGVALPPDLPERHLHFARNTADPATRGSMLTDVEAGRPLEMEVSIGWLCDRGAALGVPTPAHDMFRALLAPLAAGQIA